MAVTHEMLIAYIDDELTPEERIEVEKALEENPALMEAMGEYCRQNLMMAEMLHTEQAAAPVPVKRLKRKRPRRQKAAFPFGRVAGALAACIAVIVGYFIYTNQTVQPPVQIETIARLNVLTADTEVKRQGQVQTVRSDMALSADDTIRLLDDGVASIDWEDEATVLYLTGPADLSLKGALTKEIILNAGTLEVAAAAQTGGRSFMVITPLTKAEVVGTIFTITAQPDSSRLDVIEGTVRFIRKSDKAELQVPAGSYAEAGPGKEFKVIAPEVPERVIIEPDIDTEEPQSNAEQVLVMDPALANNGLPNGWHTVATPTINEGKNQQWKVIAGEQYGYKGPVLTQTNGSTRAAVICSDQDLPDKCEIKGRFRFLSSGDFLFYTRYHDAYNHYGFGINPRGAISGYINDKQADPDVILAEKNIKPLSRSQWHTIRIVLDGPLKTLYIDGQQVLSLAEDRIKGGGMALVTHRGRMLFGKFTVTTSE